MTLMQRARSPQEAYRQVDFDARVAGADGRALVALCFEQLHAALGSALWADAQGDAGLKSRSLTRALAALTALQLGIDPAAPLAKPLGQLYGAARTSLLDCVPQFDARVIGRIRQDFADVAHGLSSA